MTTTGKNNEPVVGAGSEQGLESGGSESPHTGSLAAEQQLVQSAAEKKRKWLWPVSIAAACLLIGLSSFSYYIYSQPRNSTYVETAGKLNLEMVWIPSGTFIMGSPESEIGRANNEHQHEVRLDGFWIGKYEVTDEQFQKGLRAPGQFAPPGLGSQLPARAVSWDQAMEFCQNLSELTGELYTLPTEAQWEYACRAGTSTAFYFGDQANDGTFSNMEEVSQRYAWYNVNSGGAPHPVGEKSPNAWGLYDMSGNIYEWCSDWYDSAYYLISPRNNPTGPPAARVRIIRGYCYSSPLANIRSSKRNSYSPTSRSSTVGFRVVRIPWDSPVAIALTAEPEDALPVAIETQAPTSDGDLLTNSIGMKLTLIQPGTFTMGSIHGATDEKPVVKVTLTEPFHLGIYEVTQGEYEKVMGLNPSIFKGSPNLPVEQVSRADAEAFCRKLSEVEGAIYRLPTEAEWEYACRAGSTTEYYWGDAIDDRFVWYKNSSGEMTHEVGLKEPNAWGLYDMSGNVYDWCQGWYSGVLYMNMGEEATNPQGPEAGSSGVIRGGAYSSAMKKIRSAYKLAYAPTKSANTVGFRVLREVQN